MLLLQRMGKILKIFFSPFDLVLANSALIFVRFQQGRFTKEVPVRMPSNLFREGSIRIKDGMPR